MYNDAYNEANNILRYKKDYDEYSKQGKTDLANAAAKKAQNSYNYLNENGYDDVANYFKNNGYSNSKNYFESFFGVKPNQYDAKSVKNKIVNLKNLYQTAADNGDKDAAERYASAAQGLYGQMYRNGDGIAAENLKNRDYNQASDYVKTYYNTLGKTAIRPYLYSKGAEYGLSQKDIDNAISYNSDTGEISLGGKNIGRADAYSDGTSYWDTGKLDAEWDDYVNRTGMAKPLDKMSNEMWQRYNKDYIEQRDRIANENPYTNDIGKSILAKYDLSAFNAGNNAAAAGAASNGGNIDSFSAANAMRNQAAMISQGQQAALDAHNSRVDKLNELIGNYAKNADTVFNESETAKNNKVSRDTAIMDTTGKVLDEYTYSDNPFLNDDGSLVDENINYKEIMENARKRLETESNADEKERLNALINYASQARQIKLGNKYNSDGRYSQWNDGDYVFNRPDTYKTWERKQQTNDLNTTLNGQIEQTKLSEQGATDRTNSTNNANVQMNKYNTDSTERINQANNNATKNLYEQGYLATDSGSGSGTKGNTITKSDIEKAVFAIQGSLPGALETDSEGNYTTKNEYKQKVIDKILSMGYSDEQCRQIVAQLGFTVD